MGQGGPGPNRPTVDVAEVALLSLSIAETAGGAVEALPITTLERPCYLADLRQATVPEGHTGALALNGGALTVSWNGAGSSMTYQAVQNVGGMSAWPPLASFTTGSVYEIQATGVGGHPMHWHVNSFQIQSMGGAASLGNGYFQAGDWHDTLYLEALGGGTLVARMNTDRFTGKMVVHCHILSHEDSGMMGYISLTGTEGAVFEEAKTLDPTCYDIAFAVASAPTSSPTPVESTITPSTTAPSTITSTASATSTSAPASSSTTSVSTSTFSSLVTPTAASSATFTASLSTSTSGSVVATTTDSSATSISAVSTATSTFMTTSAFTVASSVTSTTSNYCGCSDELEPVCGFDGATYSSACFAECYIGGYQYDGECVGASLDCGACADSDRDCKPDASATWDEVICDDGYFPVLGYYCHPGCDSCFGCFVDGTAPTTPPTSTAPVRGPASLIFLVGTMLLQ
ncbi:unnamed protein product [Prorocentrum cordatum]|nr:unnamed protein product [Polarella glacialis]